MIGEAAAQKTMPSEQQFVVEAARTISASKATYRAAALALQQSTQQSSTARIQRLNTLCQAATDYFDCVERLIRDSELLGAYRSELWAADLSGTAVNALDNIPHYYARIWKEADQLGLSRIKPSPNAFYAMQSCVAIYNPDQVDALKQRFQELQLPTRGFTHPARMNTRYENWEKIMMAATAVVFLLLMLAIGIFVKDFNDFNIFLFRTVLALVGAAFGGVFIPGVIKVETKAAKYVITASGAAAFFVIVFFFNPPALVKNASMTPSRTEAPSK